MLLTRPVAVRLIIPLIALAIIPFGYVTRSWIPTNPSAFPELPSTPGTSHAYKNGDSAGERTGRALSRQAGTIPVGFEGCDLDGFNSTQIKDAFEDLYVLTRVVASGINWQSRAAEEFLGIPEHDKASRGAVEDSLRRVAQMFEPRDAGPHKLHVRCDDLAGHCAAKFGNGLLAGYAEFWLGRIRLCKPFFNQPSLLSERLNRRMANRESASLDLHDYENTARMLLHEILHLDSVPEVPPNPYIVDVRMRSSPDSNSVNGDCTIAAYGVERVKALARSKNGPDYYVQRNADTLAWFVLAVYIEHRLNGTYPSLPDADSVDYVPCRPEFPAEPGRRAN